MGGESSGGPASSEADDHENNFICGVVEGFYGRPWTTDQRKELFKTLKKFGLNTYMYAPKDDFKHRAYWRELYSVEEADQLSGLITAAKESGIIFYYALSPGLDIVYSSAKEISCLKRKLQQVASFGCEAFALLFDDIEPEISQTDKEVFQSFSQAQVSVSNEVYQALNCPKFMFCPTEYCTARANPSVQGSEYLNTIGSKLLRDIDIMWTGPKVISKVISLESVLELKEVLKRPPVIWDNIHANDYDQKRVFLGPYSGRSTELLSNLRGVLTNPNCEYEANFIPLHTMSQWSKCNFDAKSEGIISPDVSADIRLETESESGSEDVPLHLSANTYHPKHALKLAIIDWMPELYKSKSAHGKSTVVAPLAEVVANLTVPPPALEDVDPKTLKEALSSGAGSDFIPIHKELVNSLVDPPVIINPVLEPMDCNPSSRPESPKPSDIVMKSQVQSPTSTPGSEDGNNCPSEEMQTEKNCQSEGKNCPSEEKNCPSEGKNCPSEEMQTEKNCPSEEKTCPSEDMQTETVIDRLTVEDITLLVDLFFLPFEHGPQGIQLLTEFQWLKSHGHLMSKSTLRKETTSDHDVKEWKERASKFGDMTKSVGRLFNRITFIKNRSLLYDFYPYIWDIKGVIELLNSYVKWLQSGKTSSSLNTSATTFSWYSKGYRESFMGGDQEPWLFRGGLTGELQRLIPLDSASDLFLYKAPDSPSSQVYTIRPFLPTDEEPVYDLSFTTSSTDNSMEVDQDVKQVYGSDAVGGFLSFSPEYCFVVEDDDSICGFALAAVDAVSFNQRLQVAWIPDLRRKYPLKEIQSDPSARDMIVKSIHSNRPQTPVHVLNNYPSVLCMSLTTHVMTFDSSVAKRLLTCVLAALKANGSKGVHLRLDQNEKHLVEFFAKLGFLEVAKDEKKKETGGEDEQKNVIFLGRAV